MKSKNCKKLKVQTCSILIRKKLVEEFVLDGCFVLCPVRQDVLVGHVVESRDGVQVAGVFALQQYERD